MMVHKVRFLVLASIG